MHPVIRLIDPADDAVVRQVYDLGVAAKSVGRPWFSPPRYEGWLIQLRQPEVEETLELYGAFDADGSCAGTSLLFIPTQDNLEKVYADIDVAPGRRRRGIGTELVRHATARCRQLGRQTFFTETLVPGHWDEQHGYPTFARAMGFAPAWHELTRHLRLPVPGDRLAELWRTTLPAHGDDYRIETFVGRVPADLLPGLAGLMSLLAVDAPSGAVEFDAEAVTPERLERLYDREAKQQRIRLSALAIHKITGAVAAQTDLVFDETMDPVVQEGTYVHRDHRGHRLGLAVKVANLQRLQRDYPGRPFVRTMNAETNDHMVSINLELGFELVETMTEWTIDVAASSPTGSVALEG